MPSCSICGRADALFIFPSDKEIREKWIKFCDRGYWTPGPAARICADHFSRECFALHTTRRSLIRGSVPTIRGEKVSGRFCSRKRPVVSNQEDPAQRACYRTGEWERQKAMESIDKVQVYVLEEKMDMELKQAEVKKEPSDMEHTPFEVKDDPLDIELKPVVFEEEPVECKSVEVKEDPLDTEVKPVDPLAWDRTELASSHDTVEWRLGATDSLREAVANQEEDDGAALVDSQGPRVSRISSAQQRHCLECGKLYPTALILQSHLRIYEGRKHFTCSACDLTFTCREKLAAHGRTHTERKLENSSEQLRNYEELYPTAMILQSHLRIYEGRKHYTCSACDLTFTCKKKLAAHERTHTERKLERSSGQVFFKTVLCSDKPTEHTVKKTDCVPDSQEENVQEKRPKKAAVTFSCSLCSKIFSTVGSLAVHLRRHRKQESVKKESVKKGSVKKNDSKHRNVGGTFDCSLCGRQLLSASKLASHMKIHTELNPFTCHDCEITFACNRNLLNHMSRIHGKERPFKCSVCGEAYAYKANLVYHIKVHTEEKAMKCLYCDTTFACLLEVVEHALVHRKDK